MLAGFAARQNGGIDKSSEAWPGVRRQLLTLGRETEAVLGLPQQSAWRSAPAASNLLGALARRPVLAKDGIDSPGGRGRSGKTCGASSTAELRLVITNAPRCRQDGQGPVLSGLLREKHRRSRLASADATVLLASRHGQIKRLQVKSTALDVNGRSSGSRLRFGADEVVICRRPLAVGGGP